jgi:hypothetical protein
MSDIPWKGKFLLALLSIFVGVSTGLVFGLQSAIDSNPQERDEDKFNIKSSIFVGFMSILIMAMLNTIFDQKSDENSTKVKFFTYLLLISVGLIIGLAWGYKPYIYSEDRKKIFMGAIGTLGIASLILWVLVKKDYIETALILGSLVLISAGSMFVYIQNDVISDDDKSEKDKVPSDIKNGYRALCGVTLGLGLIGVVGAIVKYLHRHQGPIKEFSNKLKNKISPPKPLNLIPDDMLSNSDFSFQPTGPSKSKSDVSSLDSLEDRIV